MHADAGASRSNSMAPLAKGTPCCTVVARGAAAGAKALAPIAISATRTFCILQMCCLKAVLLRASMQSVREHELFFRQKELSTRHARLATLCRP